MKRIYRVVYYNSQTGTAYEWFLLRREAREDARKFLQTFRADPHASVKVQVVDIPATRKGLRAALRKFASHKQPDNEGIDDGC